MTAPSDYALEVANLKKAFGGLTVTQDVSAHGARPANVG